MVAFLPKYITCAPALLFDDFKRSVKYMTLVFSKFQIPSGLLVGCFVGLCVVVDAAGT